MTDEDVNRLEYIARYGFDPKRPVFFWKNGKRMIAICNPQNWNEVFVFEDTFSNSTLGSIRFDHTEFAYGPDKSWKY